MVARRALALLAVTALVSGGGAAVAAPAPPPLLQGWIVTEQAPGRCLTGGPIGTALHTSACRLGNAAQNFYQSSEGRFTNNGNCVKPDSLLRGALVRVAACTWTDDQDWWFSTTLRAGRHGRCLTEIKIHRTGQGTVRLRDCTGAAKQKWRTRNPG